MFRPLLIGAALVIAAPAIAQTQSTNPADQPSTPLPYDPGHDSNTRAATRSPPKARRASQPPIATSRHRPAWMVML